MNIEKLKDIYKHSTNYNISFSRDSLFELIENIKSVTRNAQIESEINERYYKEIKKYEEVINELRNYLKARIEVCDNKLSTPFWDIENTIKERLILSQCLEKLEELEVEDK